MKKFLICTVAFIVFAATAAAAKSNVTVAIGTPYVAGSPVYSTPQPYYPPYVYSPGYTEYYYAYPRYVPHHGYYRQDWSYWAREHARHDHDWDRDHDRWDHDRH